MIEGVRDLSWMDTEGEGSRSASDRQKGMNFRESSISHLDDENSNEFNKNKKDKLDSSIYEAL